MKILQRMMIVVPVVALLMTPNARAAGKDVDALLQAIPGGMPLTVVVPSATEFDSRLAEAMKSLNPGAQAPGLINELNARVGMATWIDYSKPVGLVQQDLGDDNSAIIFAVVPDFATKAKGVEGAKEDGGIWTIPVNEGTTIFAMQKGPYVIATPSRTALDAAMNASSNFAAAVKPRIGLLDGKQIFAEVNFDPVRPQMLGGLMQLSMLAPMLAMQAGQSAAVDQTAIVGMIGAGTDGLQKLAEQVAVLDIAIGIDEGAVNLALRPTFADGPISQYIAAQKAGKDFFQGVSADDYMVALGWSFPGDTSDFFNYLFGKMESAMAGGGAMMGQGAQGDDGAKSAEAMQKKAKESLAVAKDMYTRTEGMSAIFGVGADGMRIFGNMKGGNPKELMDLSAKSMSMGNPISDLFGGGGKYQESGSRTIAGIDVKEFAISLDPGNPAAAKAAALYGENTRYTVGVKDGRVQYCVGPEETANAFFSAPASAALATDAAVAKVLKTLPANKNVTVVVNPAGVMRMIGTMTGKLDQVPETNAPPIGMSISLSGEARMDLRLPLAAVGPLMGASGGGPM